MFDTIDRKLLTLLQNDARQTNAELADRVGLSVSACAKRIAGYWTEGWIERTTAILNRKRFKRPVSAAVMITLSAPKTQVSLEFEAQVDKLDEVQQCHAVTGDFDYLLIVQERSIDSYHAFAQATFGSYPTVRAYKTTFLLKTSKLNNLLPEAYLTPAIP